MRKNVIFWLVMALVLNGFVRKNNVKAQPSIF